MIKSYILLLFISGCATYRTNADISFDSTHVPEYQSKVLLSEGSIPDRKFKKMRSLYAVVKKRLIFNSDPTKEQVNFVLIKEAEAIGADAVIHIRYESGIGDFTWGYISAKGKAVKFIE